MLIGVKGQDVNELLYYSGLLWLEIALLLIHGCQSFNITLSNIPFSQCVVETFKTKALH